MSEAALTLRGLRKRYGKTIALDGLELEVPKGSVFGLVGPNGAGKTTTFNMISGFYTPSEGRVLLRGDEISGLAMHEVARRGVVRTFQHSTLFAELTVLENALVGTHKKFPPNVFAAIAGRDGPARRGAVP